MVKSLMDRMPLNDGFTIPGIGYGTWNVSNDEAEEMVFMAIMRGYRLIDTGSMYGNEVGVGRGIHKAINAGISRDDIFVVTKLGKDDMGFEKATDAIRASYDRLGLKYIDLFLIHFPSPNEGVTAATWKALEEAKDSGIVRSIGVSNFMRGDLKELLENSRIKPVVNQLEINPFNLMEEVDDFGYDNNIVTMAYSPLAKGRALEDGKVMKIAEKYNKTPAQIILRWAVQRDLIPIPKTKDADRMKENLDLFDFSLTDEELERITRIKKDSNFVKGHQDHNLGKRIGVDIRNSK
ncbi:MAG: aldo/keto reductase [Trichococcus flocculiformis]|jgi:2,5-diketo-D-gluconate reductase A|uniref:Aldo/keto reductase n=1 Tax=Trichococcus flocculiformis TaxID=82803 RepID=A0A847D385_9LACT|nr:aldo/keto reductase [Trichococcus flocculiformis]NLD31140.1 aldo/keto reductase [Trichococcus flocculiformis]